MTAARRAGYLKGSHLNNLSERREYSKNA